MVLATLELLTTILWPNKSKLQHTTALFSVTLLTDEIVVTRKQKLTTSYYGIQTKGIDNGITEEI